MGLADFASVGSALISAIALVFAASELRNAYSAREIEGVFLLWDRYERYVNDYTNVAHDPDKAQIALINLLNFLENSALIYHEARKPRLVARNIRALLDGYIELYESHGSFIQALDHFGTLAGNYEELRKYYLAWQRRQRSTK